MFHTKQPLSNVNGKLVVKISTLKWISGNLSLLNGILRRFEKVFRKFRLNYNIVEYKNTYGINEWIAEYTFYFIKKNYTITV